MTDSNQPKKGVRWRRKQLLVRKAPQLTIVGYAVALTALGMLAPEYLAKLAVHALAMFPQLEMPAEVIAGIAVMGVFLLAILFGFFLSNILIGPIHGLHRHMQSLLENPGQTRPLRFRKNDFFQDVSETYNELLEQLPKKDDQKAG
jgi:sensor histidine kinase YesM